MEGTVIHIGLPRTGTTTIQKHLLKHCKKSHVFTKLPFSSKGRFTDGSGSLKGDSRQVEKFIDSVSSLNAEEVRKDLSNTLTILALGACHTNQAYRETFSRLLDCTLQKITSISEKTVYLNNERYSENSATLNGDSAHTKDLEFSVFALTKSLSRLRKAPLITICMREPVKYLRSKFMRTQIQRHNLRLRDISANEYIKKQSSLENNYPGTSVLTQAMHVEFIKLLQKHAFVKAFGFQELLASDDVFSLMGLQGEGKYAFRDFPRENNLPFTKEQEKAIEVEITQALKQYGFYDRIMKAQMFQ